VAQSFPSVENYLCTFSNSTSSETGVVKVLFGQAVPGGYLPVTLPGIAKRGFAIERNAPAAPAK
jgi:beta-N-acetylhexosaminidase